MSRHDTPSQQNLELDEQHVPGFHLMPTLRTMVIGCVDPRVDPAQLLGLKSGGAIVIRNIGGRITPSLLQSMEMLQTIARVEGIDLTDTLTLIVLHHTDCGITRLEGKPELLANYFGIDKATLASKAISDPYAAVAADVAALKTMAILPSAWVVIGMVYDVHTGVVETVIPAHSRSQE